MVLCSRYHKEITVMNKKISLSAISLLMVASSITNLIPHSHKKKLILFFALFHISTFSQSKEFDVFTDVFKQRYEIGELPSNVVDDFNKAQTSLFNRRAKIQLEAKTESEKASPNLNRIYQINCIEVPEIMKMMISNETALLKYAKKDSEVYVNFSKLISETQHKLAERDLECAQMKSKNIQNDQNGIFKIYKANKK